MPSALEFVPSKDVSDASQAGVVMRAQCSKHKHTSTPSKEKENARHKLHNGVTTPIEISLMVVSVCMRKLCRVPNLLQGSPVPKLRHEVGCHSKDGENVEANPGILNTFWLSQLQVQL